MTSEIREPILLQKLRLALSHLYAHHTDDPNFAKNRQEAHSYLIEFQSRNIRRNVTSLHQRKRDSSSELSSTLEINEETNGSSLYAVLPLLLYATPSHDTERLFCAQTILHRLRRMKSSEAIDYEMDFHEAPINVNVMAEIVQYPAQVNVNPIQFWAEFVRFHGEKISSFHPTLLGKVLQKYFQEWNHNIDPNMSPSELEERVKGEMTLQILATVAYLSAYGHAAMCAVTGNADGHGHIGPILETLSSAMAVVALRLRYTSVSLAAGSSEHRAASSAPIVTSIVRAFQTVSGFANSLTHSDLLPGIDLEESVRQSLYQQTPDLHKKTLSQCLCVSLACIPDAILGSPGGARGRLSIDPKCIIAANTEFRNGETGVVLVKEAFKHLLDSSFATSSTNINGNVYMQQQILIASERWARFVPLPLDFVEFTLLSTMPNLSRESSVLTAFDSHFCAFLIRIYEGACMGVEQVLASAAGLTAEACAPSHQLGRKKQTSKSKKRHKERLEEAVNVDDIKRNEAGVEVLNRGIVACHAAMLTWDSMQALFLNNLANMDTSNLMVVEGEGPVGCMCTCVSACLPFFIRHGPIPDNVSRSTALFSAVSEALQKVCSSGNRSVRALAFEHITGLHKTLVETSKSTNLTEIESLSIQNICECSMILSRMCAYPNGYFDDLAQDNDEDLEVERNDVRDLLREVCNLDNDTNHISVIIFDRIVQYCADNVSGDNSQNGLPSETIIHALSAPAKSLQRLASEIQAIPLAEKIINSTLDILGVFCERLLSAFSSALPMETTLPISRLICITVASFANFFSSMIESMHVLKEDTASKVRQTIGLSVLVLVASIKNIPELIAASTLVNTRYDIRGSMRPPGGEDHCGCIAFTRIVKAGRLLTNLSVEYAAQASNSDILSIFIELTSVNDNLHRAEMMRPPGQLFGEGVTAKSRRMYLTSMTKIGLVVMDSHPHFASQISSELKAMINKPVEVITTCNQRSELTDDQKIYLLCEACFDLAAFPSLFCKELFASNSLGTKAAEILIGACISGYQQMIDDEPSESIIQWGRLRGAISSLICSCADPGLSDFAVEACKALIDAECNAIAQYCSQNANATNSIFNELVISDDVLPAGMFINSIREIIIKLRSADADLKVKSEAISSCVSVLSSTKQSVFAAVASYTTVELDAWDDPRPTVFEAWLLAMNELIQICFENNIHENQLLRQLGSETLAVSVQVLMSKRVDKEEMKPGQLHVLSLDGPQTLAMVEFFELVLKFGFPIFSEINTLLQQQMHLETLPSGSCDPLMIGGGIIVSSIYRCSSGAVPPWAIEYLQDILKALFHACGGTDPFLSILFAGTDLKLKEDCRYGVIAGGGKLAGFYYDKIKPRSKDEFIRKVTETCLCKDNTKWRKLKVLIKAVCGGKKKASDFNLKPQFTNWESDRV